MKDFKTAFFFLRLPMAISLLGHGLVRLPKLSAFAEGMVMSMGHSFLPGNAILAFGYILPPVEAVLGITLITGFKARYTLYGSLMLMAILIFGSATVENWAAVQAQLVHSIYIGLLFWYYERHVVDLED